MDKKISIRELSVGTAVVIVAYNRVYGGYVGKLLVRGLTIGKNFIVLEKNLPEGCVKIMLEEKIIQLSKPEAYALYVEPVNSQ